MLQGMVFMAFRQRIQLPLNDSARVKAGHSTFITFMAFLLFLPQL
jgi:hypothetical protein